MSSTVLSEVLTLAEVQSLAGDRTFARGLAYFHEGSVSRLEIEGEMVGATVSGTHRYRVTLAAVDGALRYACNCPVGDGGVFCKHAVAVALSWLENTGEAVFRDDAAEAKAAAKPRRKRKTHAERVQEYVATLDTATLQAWVIEACDRDRGLRDRLLLAARAAGASDLAGMKAAVRQAARVARFLDWREAHGYAEGLMQLAEVLRQRLSGPHAAEVVELAELAVAEAEKSLEQIDDSNGGVMPAIHVLAEVHLAACRATRPDPEALAQRLFLFQTQGEWDTFHDVLPAYAEPLGEAGLLRYRTLVNEAWDARPTPVGRDGLVHDLLYNRLRDAMAALAELDGDVDALVAIHARSLSIPYDFLRLAQLCRTHGRDDEALAWAERGLAEAGNEADRRLLDFCIEAYLARQAFDRADACAWRRFAAHPCADAFPALMKVAIACGTREAVRERALAAVEAMTKAGEAAVAARPAGWLPRGRTELVGIHLALEDHDAAWEAFSGGPVDAAMARRMAAVRGKRHPHDAIAVYHRLLPAALEQGTYKARYDDAFEIVKAIRALRGALGEAAEFAAELDRIRSTWRAKRNFIALLATLN